MLVYLTMNCPSLNFAVVSRFPAAGESECIVGCSFFFLFIFSGYDGFFWVKIGQLTSWGLGSLRGMMEGSQLILLVVVSWTEAKQSQLSLEGDTFCFPSVTYRAERALELGSSFVFRFWDGCVVRVEGDRRLRLLVVVCWTEAKQSQLPLGGDAFCFPLIVHRAGRPGLSGISCWVLTPERVQAVGYDQVVVSFVVLTNPPFAS